jgi:formylglycine-generating enzyme required for sulfatase activity
MTHQQADDITELALLNEQFSLRLKQLGFRLMQVTDVTGQDQYRYVIPPICEISAGSFLMGSDPRHDPDAQEAEMPQSVSTLSIFHIGTYPLTVMEYACFVQATNHTAPPDWGSQQHHADHPVVSVSWRDALAYAQWLAQVTGEPWRLSTEAEWEKAARGIDGRIYPWGNQWDNTRANTKDEGLKATTPVGSYPGGASPYGTQDMVGNVWEWTSTTYQRYPYQADDGREDAPHNLRTPTYKVLRGGSWAYFPLHARAAYRGYDLLPSDTYNDFGTRLVHGGLVG